MPLLKTCTFLKINHITVRYLDHVLLPDLSFTMHEGENFAITGKSGSGKTSFLQTILGKYNIVNGSISYPFFESFKTKYHIEDPLFIPRQLIAFVPQEAHFKNKQHMADFYYQQRFNSSDGEEAVTVNEYIREAFSSVDKRIYSSGVRFSLEWIILHLNLDYLLDKTIIQLSHGETRRLLIAKALLKQPLLLLLDNPLMGLDVTTRPFFYRLMSQISSKGTQIILVTNPDEIPACITHVIELGQGSITGEWTRNAFVFKSTQETDTIWQPDQNKLLQLTKNNDTNKNDFDYVLQMKDIHVKYGNTAILSGINWTIRKGEKWALLGPNGAGKSTLLSLISGDNPQAYANTIYLFDKKRGSGESIWDIKRQIGFVSPELHIYFKSNSSCLDVVLSGYTDTMNVNHKKINKEQVIHVITWMRLLDTDELKDQKFKQLPAGKQRLILLLRALVKNPPLLILDEPCQGLDEEQKSRFKNVIGRICTDPDRSLIYVTHYPDEIPSIVNHTLHLKKGKVIETE